MSLGVAVWTGLALLLLGIAKTTYDLKIAPWLYDKSKQTESDINKRLDARSKRDKWAATIFLLLTAAFSIWSIKDSIMTGQVTKQDFDALEVRVRALENDRPPPGAAQALTDRLSSAERSLEEMKHSLKSVVTLDDLKKTRKELEETIEKATAEIKRLKTLISQRGQVQGGT